MFFNPNEVLKFDFLLNFIVSERGAGKTFSTLLYAVNRFIETGKNFVYLRRTETELELSEPTLLQQLQVEGFHSDNTIKISKGFITFDGKTMGRTIAINTAYKLKSTSFPDVDLIIFDEFISENGRYLKNEPEKFLSVIETIARLRNIQIICLGNQSTKYNPYYIYFKIKPVGKQLTRFRDKSILIYEFKSDEYRKTKSETKFAKLIKDTKYGEFMLENKAINDDYSFIDTMKGCPKIPVANIIIENNNIVVYEATTSDDFMLYFAVKDNLKDIKTINFDKMLVENATLETLKSHSISRRISNNLRRGTIRFDDMNTKNLVQNFIF